MSSLVELLIHFLSDRLTQVSLFAEGSPINADLCPSNEARRARDRLGVTSIDDQSKFSE
jgi:hypothetical protein